MPILNTYTEEFDWFRMSPHHIEDNGSERSIKVINDHAHVNFGYKMEDPNNPDGVDSSKGEVNEAYKNWRNINLALGPMQGITNPVLCGQVRQDKQAADNNDPHDRTTSWFQGVSTGDFKTDGLIYMPAVDYKPGRSNHITAHNANSSYNAGHAYSYTANSYADNTGYGAEANVIQYHVPGGLAPNTWMPLFMWDVSLNPNMWGYSNGFNWLTDGLDKNTAFWEKYADYAVNGGNPVMHGAHMMMRGMRTAAHEDTVWNTYDTQASKSWFNDDGNRATSHGWGCTTFRPGEANPVIWWYAHDGDGNSMIISTSMYWHAESHGAAGYAYNGLWDSGKEGGGGAAPMSSGGWWVRPPTHLQSGPLDTSGSDEPALHKIQRWANEQRTTWVYKDANTNLSAWTQPAYWTMKCQWYNDHRSQFYPAGHRPEIIHGLTPFGDNADLSDPQNLYLHRLGRRVVINQGRPVTSYKFGNLVKTRTRNAFRNGHGRGQDASLSTARNQTVANGNGDLSLILIAAHQLPSNNKQHGSKQYTDNESTSARINMYTCGGHVVDDGPAREDDTELFYEFPGVGATYGAVKNDASKVTLLTANTWTNAEALVDPTNTNDAICKASGKENAVLVELTGHTEEEDSEPANSDQVGTVAITLGGTRKMVLGPQVLKVQLVKNDGQSALTGEKTITGSGSDTISDDITLVYRQNGGGLDPSVTYSDIKDAKIKIWVETPS